MRVAVMGTGGLGGFFGGLLARAGHEVTFIARGAHLEAIREHGLRVKSEVSGEFTVRANATTDPAEVGPVDFVLFTVKTYDLEAAVEAIQPLVGPDTVVMPLQNGVDVPDRIARDFGREHVVVGLAEEVGDGVARRRHRVVDAPREGVGPGVHDDVDAGPLARLLHGGDALGLPLDRHEAAAVAAVVVGVLEVAADGAGVEQAGDERVPRQAVTRLDVSRDRHRHPGGDSGHGGAGLLGREHVVVGLAGEVGGGGA